MRDIKDIVKEAEREAEKEMKKFKELPAKDKERLGRDLKHGIADVERWKKIRLTRYGRLWFFLIYEIKGR